MKRTFLTAFALLSLLATGKAEEKPNPVKDTTAVKHLNLSEVKISASRVNAKMKDLPQKVEVITSRVIQSTPALDMGELLKKTSGVDIIQYPGVSSAISIRGFAPSTSNKYSVILINGKPAGTKNIATIDLSNVERVEILKGPFSAQFGSSAMAGVINIVTKETTGDIKGNVNLAFGSFSTSKASVNVGGDLSEDLDFDFSYNFQKRNSDYKIGKKNLLGKKKAESILDPASYGAKMEHSRFERHNVDARLGLKLSKDWKINLNQSIFVANGIETPGSFWHVHGKNSKDIKKDATGIDILGKIGIHNLSLSPYYSKEKNKTINDVFGNSESVFKNYGFLIQDAFTIGKHNIAFGFDNKHEIYESTKWDKKGEEIAPYKPNYGTEFSGIFGQFSTKALNDKLNLAIGMRYDYIESTLKKNPFLKNDEKKETYSVFTKNIGAKYEIIKGLQAHASWGNAFLAPDAYQIAGFYKAGSRVTKGNPDLKPEFSNTYDLGMEYKNFAKGISLDITYFKTKHKDKIVSSRVDPDPKVKGDEYSTFKNALRSSMDGIEVMASYDFGSLFDYDFSLKLYANYTQLFDSYVKEKKIVKETIDGKVVEKSVTVKGDMKYVRDKNASFGLEYDNLKGFQCRLNGRYIGRRYEDNWYTYYSNARKDHKTDRILRHPSSYVFDYDMSYTFKKNYTLGLTVSNLLDENYTEKDGYNMPGRSFMVKVGYKF